MSVWDTYEQRLGVHGTNKRDATYIREVRSIYNRLPDNLSYCTVDICPSAYGYNIESDECLPYRYSQDVAIINSDNLNEKTIISMPNDDIALGSLVLWMDNHWLVVERDANSTIYTRAKLLQCNHILKWIVDDNKIIEQWCVVEDGTKLRHAA